LLHAIAELTRFSFFSKMLCVLALFARCAGRPLL
jgi:hypothetical protein